MFCGGCGTQVPEGTQICPKCGMMIVTRTTENKAAEPTVQNAQPTQSAAGTMPDYNSYQSNTQGTANSGSQPNTQMPDYNSYQMNTQIPGAVVPPVEQPGRGLAIASLVLGIISIVFCMTGWVAVVCGIIGLVLAHMSKKQGNTSGVRTGGFVCSLIGLIIGAIILLIAIIAIVTATSMIGSMDINVDGLDLSEFGI